MPARIEQLTPDHEARLEGWADRWIEIGLRTGPVNWKRFEAAVRECYRYAEIPWPGVVVRVPSPLIGALAAPVAVQLTSQGRGWAGYAIRTRTIETTRRAVDDAVDPSVARMVDDRVGEVVRGAVRAAVDDEMLVAVQHAARDGERWMMQRAVEKAVRGATGRSARAAVRTEMSEPMTLTAHHYCGGQFWAGGWTAGVAVPSYFRDVCGLTLGGDLWARARATEATVESACWWWPTTDFVMISERPTIIELEQVGARGSRSHQLHSANGPAIAWNGWSLYYYHGVRVPEKLIEAPEALTPREVLAQPNVEVRRAMVERLGTDWLLSACEAAGAGMSVLEDEDRDAHGRRRRLLRLSLAGEEPLMLVEVANATAEPGVSFKNYLLRVPPTMRTCHEAVAWTFSMSEDEYAPASET
jgi:hypothetical protein